MTGDRGGGGSHGADLWRSGRRRRGRSTFAERSWPAAAPNRGWVLREKGRRSSFPPGTTLYRTGSTTGSSGQGPEVPGQAEHIPGQQVVQTNNQLTGSSGI